MTIAELRRVARHYRNDSKSFLVGFSEGFIQALNFLGVDLKNVQLPAKVASCSDSKVPLLKSPSEKNCSHGYNPDDCTNGCYDARESAEKVIADPIAKAVAEMNVGLYGPRYCGHCKQVQPVKTYKLEGSDYTRVEGMKATAGFMGSHVCTVCHRTIESGSDTSRG